MNPKFTAHIELRRIFAAMRPRTPISQVLSPCVSPLLDTDVSSLNLGLQPVPRQEAGPFFRPKGA